MNTIDQHIAFCKAQAAYHERKSSAPNLTTHSAQKHSSVSEKLIDVAKFLASMPAHISSPPDDVDTLFRLDPFNMTGVPDDLIKELKIGAGEKIDAEIIELFRIADRPLNISEVLIGLYRRFNEEQKRTAVSARLYRLSNEGILMSVEKNRGIYRIAEQEEAQQ